ncbi:MAG: hypothetical protein HY925_04110 [Elusimicrobia bacterium]|nr:hypothetical protein [Elusimicrobiota bacterium]
MFPLPATGDGLRLTGAGGAEGLPCSLLFPVETHAPRPGVNFVRLEPDAELQSSPVLCPLPPRYVL